MNSTEIKAKIEELRQQRDAADATIANLEELLAKPRTGRVWSVEELQKEDVVYTAKASGVVAKDLVRHYSSAWQGEVAMGTLYWDAASAERHILRQQATVALEKAAKEACEKRRSDICYCLSSSGVAVSVGSFVVSLAALRGLVFPTYLLCQDAFAALGEEQRKAYLEREE